MAYQYHFVAFGPQLCPIYHNLAKFHLESLWLSAWRLRRISKLRNYWAICMFLAVLSWHSPVVTFRTSPSPLPPLAARQLLLRFEIQIRSRNFVCTHIKSRHESLLPKLTTSYGNNTNHSRIPCSQYVSRNKSCFSFYKSRIAVSSRILSYARRNAGISKTRLCEPDYSCRDFTKLLVPFVKA